MKKRTDYHDSKVDSISEPTELKINKKEGTVNFLNMKGGVFKQERLAEAECK